MSDIISIIYNPFHITNICKQQNYNKQILFSENQPKEYKKRMLQNQKLQKNIIRMKTIDHT